jgi:AraC-like DNA-binding protein
VVLHANRFQFQPRQTIENPRVGSRMLLWGKAGGGAVTVDGRERRLVPDGFLLLPWNHRVRYQADARQPFLVAAIHLIPRHDPVAALRFIIPHTADHPLADMPQRRDLSLPGLGGLVEGDLRAHPRLAHLAEHILAVFDGGQPGDRQARQLGQLLLDELLALQRHDDALPAVLAELRRRLLADLAHPHDLGGLARLAGVSPATLARLCRRHLRQSPRRWLTGLRLDQAERLLAATPLPIGEVGRQVGLPDPYQFSRLFRRWRRRTASDARARAWRR